MSLRVLGAHAALVATVAAAGCSASLPALERAAAAHATTAPAPAVRTGTWMVGDVFHYAGSTVRSSGGGSTRAAVTQTVTVTATPYPYANRPGAADFHSAETDRSDGRARTWTADAWRGYGPPAGGVAPFLLYGVSVEDAGDSFLYRYPVAQTTDRQPQQNGASWSNGATLRYRERDADGTTAQASYAAGGAYAERVRYAASCGYSGACTLDAAVLASGASRVLGSALTASGTASIGLSAPRAGSIEIDYTYLGGSQQRLFIPAWFAADKPLYAEDDRIVTGEPRFRPPAPVPRVFGSGGNVVIRNVSQIDPAAGTSEREVTRTYSTQAYGTVCSVLSSAVLQYYDYATGVFSGTPIASANESETLSLRSERLENERSLGEAVEAAQARLLTLVRQRAVRAFDPSHRPSQRPRVAMKR